MLRGTGFALAKSAPMDANCAASVLRFRAYGGLSVLEPTRALLPNAPIVYAADSAGYPVRQAERSGDRQPRSRPARPARRALPPAACGDRLQHRLDHRARSRPVGARPSGRRHRFRRSSPRRNCRRAASSACSAPRRRFANPMSTTSPRASRPTAPSSAMARPELVDLAEAKLAGDEVTGRRMSALRQPMFDANPRRRPHRRRGARLHPLPAAGRAELSRSLASPALQLDRRRSQASPAASPI